MVPSKMVDVAGKPVTQRVAVAQAEVRMKPAALALRQQRHVKKRRRPRHCANRRHPRRQTNGAHHSALPSTHADPHRRQLHHRGERPGAIRCAAACSGQTGVEMEALTGAAVAALTIYDMCKAADRAMSIERVELVEKNGGKSGHFQRRARA